MVVSKSRAGVLAVSFVIESLRCVCQRERRERREGLVGLRASS